MENFTNNQISFDNLPSLEEVTYTPIHKDYLNVIYISNTIFSVVLGIAVSLMLLFIDNSSEFALYLIGLLFFVIAALFVTSNIGFKRKGYAIREKDLMFKKGVLSTTTTIIPFNRIQHVAINEGFFSRMYNLTELQIYTAGGSSSDVYIPGLQKEVAEKIKILLLNIITSESLVEDSIVAEVEILENKSLKQDESVDFIDNSEKNQ